MATYLDGILEWHRARAAGDGRDVGRLIEEAASRGDARDFSGELSRRRPRRDGAGAGGHMPAVIAEVKRRSPSKGEIAADLDPAAAAADYEQGGAACLSVLTDRQFFAGSPADLVAARAATLLPVLRKDFTVCEADVCDARLMGADCVLLIAAALDDALLLRLAGLARSLGMDAILEVHDETEAARALDAGASIIGVNQRDLATFEVDPTRAERVREQLPASVLTVAESGISSPEEARRLGEAGYDAVLVGEALVRSPDRAAAVRRLVGPATAGSASSDPATVGPATVGSASSDPATVGPASAGPATAGPAAVGLKVPARRGLEAGGRGA